MDGGDGGGGSAEAAALSTGSFCVGDGWCWQRPLPFGADMNAAWGSAANDVWAVGNGGILAHYDGASWALQPSGVVSDLLAMWGSAAHDVWAVGSGGTILHFDGSAWGVIPGPTTSTLRGIYGSSASSVYAVGDTDTRLAYDGTTWTKLSSIFLAGAPNLYGVWASSPSDVWAVGNGYTGYFVHFDGTAWNIVSAQGSTQETVTGVWGSSPSSVWMTEWPYQSDSIQSWDGTSLNYVAVPSSVNLFAPTFITGTGPTDVWFIGGQQTSARWDGTQFITSTGLNLTAASGAWLSVSPPGDGWAVGPSGLLAHKTTVTGDWSVASGEPGGGYDTLSAISVVSDSDVWVAGRLTLTHWDGAAWTTTPPAVTTYLQEFNSIWAASGSDAWACAWGNNPDNLQHWDGTSWKVVAYPGPVDLNAVWGASSNDVWLAGADGSMGHYDGTSWVAASARPAGILSALHGTGTSDVWAVGAGGLIAHWDGAGWAASASSVTQDLAAVHAFSPLDAWAGGAGPTLLHWNGTAWSAAAAPPVRADLIGNRTILAIAGTSAMDLWVAATGGDIFRWDGSAWTKSATVGVEVYALAATPSGAHLAAGGSGSILRRGP